jgi:adenylate cyclase
MNKTNRIRFHRSITFRLPMIILVILSIGLGLTAGVYTWRNNQSIIQNKEREIDQEVELVYTAIRNNMLAGEASIAVQLFKDFQRSDFATDIRLFRVSGRNAFSDGTTIEDVNRILGAKMFAMQEKPLEPDTDASPELALSVKEVNDVSVRHTRDDSVRLTIYKPLINQPKCTRCHGLDHVVRGIIRVSSPLDEAYAEARRNLLLSAGMYSVAVFFLTMIIISFLRRTLLRRIFTIGDVVEQVGEGNFRVRINERTADEIGVLSGRINTMIEGLNQRFKLERFVSRSTLEHISGEDDIRTGGERKTLTVLFSDIRGFTSYSETHDPEHVMQVLNAMMNLQSDIVHRWHGDIDKYVGDELMAVFEGDEAEKNAVSAALEIIDTVKEFNLTANDPVQVGIGISSGEMIAGNMGSARRLDRTVIGDTVNLGARLCSIAPGGGILVNERVYELVKRMVRAKRIRNVRVKGKEEPLTVYSLGRK